MSEQKTCDEIINQLAAEAYESYPHKDDVVNVVAIANEVDETAHKLLTWIKQDPRRRAALATVAGGSSCQLSAARAVRHGMIELHRSGHLATASVREPAMA